MAAIVLFRNDLRLEDNPAFYHACTNCDAVIPLYCWDPDPLQPWAPGGASCVGIHQALQQLDDALKERGSRLCVAQGDNTSILQKFIVDHKVQVVYWNRRYTPQAIAADTELKATLQEQGVAVHSYNASLLTEPGSVLNKSGKPFRVFTPFWKHCQTSVQIRESYPLPEQFKAPVKEPDTLELQSLKLQPAMPWVQTMKQSWDWEQDFSMEKLQTWCEDTLVDYPDGRDALAEYYTSGMSTALALGLLSPHQLWNAVTAAVTQNPALDSAATAFTRQLFWREFAYHLLYHYPETTTTPLKSEFNDFPWREDTDALQRWQQGQTGYPVVDAGMRELWATGYMHNRARMITASFLVKDLLIPWQQGAQWFWDTLLDADLANNTLGWQWVAGCGADAAPYFRIFNPVRQGERFDPDGVYVRKWVPELAKLPDKYLHAPWTAPAEVLTAAGIELGAQYPNPMVDHSEARDAAMTAYQAMRQTRLVESTP